MKAWSKVALGLGAGALVGIAAAIFGKKRNDDDEYVEVECAEDCDSDSDANEAE